MKKKIMQIGYVLVIIGLIVGGVYNICTSHPILSQYYTKAFSKETQTENQKESKENQKQIETKEEFTEKDTYVQKAFDSTEGIHIHTWENDMEWTWVGNKDGTGHVEKIIVEKCECGEYKTN